MSEEVAGEAPAPPAASLLPIAAATVTVILWASAFIAIRFAGRQISPGALTLGRLIVGSVVLGTVVLLRQPVLPDRRDWPRLLLCGFAWLGIYNLALNEAERHLDAGTTAMVVNVGPVVIAILARLVLHEGFPRGLIAGGAIAFAGVIVISLSTAGIAHADALGIVLCLVAACAYATGVISQKPALARNSALTVTWTACTIGALCCLPFVPLLVRDVSHAQFLSVAAIVYLGAFPTAIAFTTWAYALSRTTAGKMGVTTYLVPPIAVLLGWLLLGEHPAALAVAGGVVCLLGVYVTRR